ncbi:MAG: hypothetical protein HOW73_45650 [Polyangiaceae bacterium]|nr:hypothetical protein [Polyangiaceae bacterium]
MILDGTLFESAEGGSGGDGGNGGATSPTSNTGGSNQGGGSTNGGGGAGGEAPLPEWVVGAAELEQPVRFVDVDVSEQQIIVAGIAQGPDGGGTFSLGPSCVQQVVPPGWTPFVAFYDDNGACQKVLLIDQANAPTPPLSVSVAHGTSEDAAFVGISHDGQSKIYVIQLGNMIGDGIDFGPNAGVNDLVLGEQGLVVAGWNLEGNTNPCQWAAMPDARRQSMLVKFDPTDLECSPAGTLGVNAPERDDEIAHVSVDTGTIYITGYVSDGSAASVSFPCTNCVFSGESESPFEAALVGPPVVGCAFPPVVVASGEAWTTDVSCDGLGNVNLVNKVRDNGISALETAGASAYSMALTPSFVYGAGAADRSDDGGPETFGFITRASTGLQQGAEGFFITKPEAPFQAQSEIRGVASLGNAIVIAGTYSGEVTCQPSCGDVVIELTTSDGESVLTGEAHGCAGPLCGPFLALWQPGLEAK